VGASRNAVNCQIFNVGKLNHQARNITFRSSEEPRGRSSLILSQRYSKMSKETPKDDPRQRSDQGSHRQTDKPWKGNPEKDQRNDGAKIDLEKWHETNTH